MTIQHFTHMLLQAWRERVCHTVDERVSIGAGNRPDGSASREI